MFRRGCIKWIHIGEGDAVSFRLGAPRDAGMVPLSSRETAKGGTQIPQTRFAQTVRSLRPNAVTRELRGSQIPGSRRSQAETHRCGMVGRKEWGCDSGEEVYRWFMQCLKKAQKTLV